MTYEYVPNETCIGYWARKNDPPGLESYGGQILILPVENSATQDQSDIIARLKKAYTTGHMIGYRGWSTCRICGKHNGTQELEIIRGRMKYRIPEGYVHYLEDHSVAYDPQLLELV